MSQTNTDHPVDENGLYEQLYTDEQFIEAIEAAGGFASASEIAGELGVHRVTAYNRLRDLADDDRIETRKVGPSRIWLSQ